MEKKQKRRKEKGITLVALVVTIINRKFMIVIYNLKIRIEKKQKICYI